MTDSLTMQRIGASLQRRHRANARLRNYGLAAVCAALGFLAVMLVVIVSEGATAFKQTTVALDVQFDRQKIDPKNTGDPDVIRKGDFQGLVKESLRRAFPEVKSRKDKRELYKMVSGGAPFELREMVMADPSLIGQRKTVWLLASDDVDMVSKGRITREGDSDARRVSDQQFGWYDDLKAVERLDSRFNKVFFTSGDSREPELAGVLGAVMGSFYALLVCLVLAFPLGVAASIYLEEFAPKNRWTAMIEVNINNLAAVPSIVFGLLGLAMFLGFMGLPRSAPLVGGMVLALMTPADDRDCRTGRHQGRAAEHQTGRHGARRQPGSGGVSTGPAAGHARDADRNDHRHGPGAWRNRAAAHDRHGGVYRRYSGQRRLDPATALPVQDLSFGRTARNAHSSRKPRRRSWFCWCSSCA